MLQEIIEDTRVGMDRSLQALDVAFKRIRTGRASPALLDDIKVCLLYTSPSPRDGLLSRMPSSA